MFHYIYIMNFSRCLLLYTKVALLKLLPGNLAQTIACIVPCVVINFCCEYIEKNIDHKKNVINQHYDNIVCFQESSWKVQYYFEENDVKSKFEAHRRNKVDAILKGNQYHLKNTIQYELSFLFLRNTGIGQDLEKTYMTPSFPLKYGSSIITQFSILY